MQIVLSSTISRVQPSSPVNAAADFPIYDSKTATVKRILPISHVWCACAQLWKRSYRTVCLGSKGVRILCSESANNHIGLQPVSKTNVVMLGATGSAETGEWKRWRQIAWVKLRD